MKYDREVWNLKQHTYEKPNKYWLTKEDILKLRLHSISKKLKKDKEPF